MIFDFPNIKFSDEEWIKIIIQYLNSWTEIPLNIFNGYDKDTLKFYDGLFGTLLKQTEQIHMTNPEALNKKFVDSWKYQGKLYRVLHASISFDENGEKKFDFPCVDYHGMISHWTDDFTFKGIQYKLSPNNEYIILETDTKEHFAFDVNKFRKKNNCRNKNTEKEREIIYPMYQENTTEYRMSINEFIKMKKDFESS